MGSLLTLRCCEPPALSPVPGEAFHPTLVLPAEAQRSRAGSTPTRPHLLPHPEEEPALCGCMSAYPGKSLSSEVNVVFPTVGVSQPH